MDRDGSPGYFPAQPRLSEGSRPLGADRAPKCWGLGSERLVLCDATLRPHGSGVCTRPGPCRPRSNDRHAALPGAFEQPKAEAKCY